MFGSDCGDEVKAAVSVGDQVRTLIADQYLVDCEDVTPKAKLDHDLGGDSIDLVELAMLIEEKFDLHEISDEEVEKWVRVKDVVGYVEGAVKS